MKTYIWAEDPRPVCEIPDGGFSSPSQIEGCKLPENYSGPLFVLSSKIVDKHGHMLSGDSDPLGKGGCRHKRHGGKAMEKETKVVAEASAPPTQMVGIPHVDPIVKEQPKGDPSITTALIVGAISGVIGSYFGPLIKTLVQRLLKKLLKKGGPDSKADKEDKEVSCKAHNLKCTIRSVKFSEKIDDLQKKLEELADSRRDSLFGTSNLTELEERINKIEKNIKKKG